MSAPTPLFSDSLRQAELHAFELDDLKTDLLRFAEEARSLQERMKLAGVKYPSLSVSIDALGDCVSAADDAVSDVKGCLREATEERNRLLPYFKHVA